jgi:Flp pilus assembly protein TadG
MEFLMRKSKKFSSLMRAFANESRGVAAIEFALIVPVLAAGIVNAADIAIYLIDRLQIENATEMGAQAAWQTCDLTHIPATTNCANLSSAVTAGIQRTTLGSHITLRSGSPSEGYYCVNSSGSLQYVSSVSNKPADCSAAGTPSNLPADYIKVDTTYSYAPLFPGLSVGGLFDTPITRTAWMRMG